MHQNLTSPPKITPASSYQHDFIITGDYSATSPPVIIKKNKERKKKELSKNVEEEIFGSIEEELGLFQFRESSNRYEMHAITNLMK